MQTDAPPQAILATYSVARFNALPEFHESKGRFADRNAVLNEFGKTVRKHHVEKYLGAALIHKHFPLNEGERVVEEVAPDGSLLGARRGVYEDSLTPYLWHLSYSNPRLFQWTPVEFVISETIPTRVRAFASELQRRMALLSELATLLVEGDAQDTFGLALLHRQHIKFDRSIQVLLESPGPSDRTLKVTPVNPSVTTSDEWTQTYWHFDVDVKGIVNGCSQHGCAGYCSLHK